MLLTTMSPSKQTDVLIIGGGSAGLTAAVWLARCGIPYTILEKRRGPLEMGQADGVQTRTVEIFESFGISEELLKEAYHVLELAFWAPDGQGGIERTHYAADVEPGLSHMPHVILNQARMNGLLTEEMARARRANGGEGTGIEYGFEVTGVKVDESAVADPGSYCVSVTARRDDVEEVWRAKYVLGSDGAHSLVRRALGLKMIGDSSDAVWGVMDVHVRTNFPDIRKKAMLNSEAGNLMIIPREGNSLVRFYTELQGALAKNVTLESLQERARQIFSPYTMDIAETVWWSAYSIGQRLADHFHKDYRVFLSGDACHTHSPKAGQGMNVSLQDGYNIGWKLAAVLRGQAKPELLKTYVSERQKTAAELIAFDRSWTKLFSTSYRKEHGITQEEFHKQFIRAGRYTAGQAIRYDRSIICSPDAKSDSMVQGIMVGMRFPSAQVVRFCDARAMQLVRALPATSAWHVVVFAGDIRKRENMEGLKEMSAKVNAIVRDFTPAGADLDSVLNPILVLYGKRTEIEQEDIPEVFTPVTGKYKAKSLFKTFVDDESYNSGHGHAYEEYNVDPESPAVVLVRPDHYVAKICQFDEIESIRTFFDGFMN